MSLTTRPQTFTRDDLSTAADPHVVIVIERRGKRRGVREVIGPFPDEATAFGFIGEHDLGGGSQIVLIAPLTAAIDYAARGGER